MQACLVTLTLTLTLTLTTDPDSNPNPNPNPNPSPSPNAGFCLVILCLFPFVVAAKVQGVAMASAIAFLGVTMMYSLNEVAP